MESAVVTPSVSAEVGVFDSLPGDYYGGMYSDSDRARFLNFFISGEPDACWIWTGCLNSRGYGCFAVGGKGKSKLAHRVAVEMETGEPIPKGKQVCHHCDVKSCVNPLHLYIGTPRSNTRDAIERGQFPTGERNGRARLTEDDVRAIRRRWAAGGVTISSLAREFGVTRPPIRDVVKGKSWKGIR